MATRHQLVQSCSEFGDTKSLELHWCCSHCFLLSHRISGALSLSSSSEISPLRSSVSTGLMLRRSLIPSTTSVFYTQRTQCTSRQWCRQPGLWDGLSILCSLLLCIHFIPLQSSGGNISWPLMSVPSFSTHATRVLHQTGARTMGVAHIVQPKQ